MTDKPYVVVERYGRSRRFATLTQAKNWPLEQLEKQKKFAFKYGTDGIEPIMSIASDLDDLTEFDLEQGPIEVGGIVDPHSQAPMFWTFMKEAA